MKRKTICMIAGAVMSALAISPVNISAEEAASAFTDDIIISEEETAEGVDEAGEVVQEEKDESSVIIDDAVDEAKDTADAIPDTADMEEPETETSPEAGTAELGSISRQRARRAPAASAASFQESYGDQLQGDQKTVYDALVSHWGDLKSTEGFIVQLEDPITITVDSTDDEGNAVIDDEYKKKFKYQKEEEFTSVVKPAAANYVYAAMDAFLYDRPEIFWMSRVNYRPSGKTPYTDGTVTYQDNGDGTTDITFHVIEIVSGVESWTGASGMIQTFQSKVNAAVSEIAPEVSETGSDAMKTKVIGDYVADMTEYAEPAGCHTAYGPFCQGQAVCDGYTKAFDLLCSKFGIKAVMGSGDVHTSVGTEAHAWSYVSLNGEWYLTDITFNDTGVLDNGYTLVGTETKPGGTSESIGEERTKYTRFSTTDQSRTLVQPVVSKEAYHEWKETARTEPSCTKEGSYDLVCLIHGEVETEVLPMTEHAPDDGIVTKEATCTETGTLEIRCVVCGTVLETRDIPKKEHVPDNGTVTKKATCTEKGTLTIRCRECGRVLEEKEIPMIKHSPGKEEVTKQAECAKEGTAIIRCTVCGRILSTRAVPATGKHTAGGWKISENAGCGKEGKEIRQCTVCGKTMEKRVIPATGDHAFSEWKTRKEAGCTETGLQYRACSVCGKKETRPVNALGHDLSEWSVSRQATALSSGTETRACGRCGASETRRTVKLSPTGDLTVTGTLPMKTGQKVSGIYAKGLAEEDHVLSWTSSNKKIVTVRGTSSVSVKAKKKTGKAVITAHFASGMTKSFTVKVQKKKVKTSSLSVSRRTIYLKKGQRYQITAERKPISSSDKVTYRSSSKKTASVNKKGKITAKKKGKAVITVISGKKKVKVTVYVSG